MTTRLLGIVVAVACSVSGTAEATTNLKPFDPVALQGIVETTAKELLLPGAMVLLRTPQGDFCFRLRRDGTGRPDPAVCRHAFPGCLEHQEDDVERFAAGLG
jgi:D-alanyl-D-alanine carboxypeptidase